MKLHTTQNILVELTSEELEILNTSLICASVKMDKEGWNEEYITKVMKLWDQVYDIQKSLPF